MDDETAVWLTKIVRGIVGKFCARVHHFTEFDDMVAYAMLQCVIAEKRYDPRQGTLKNHFWLRAEGAVKDYVRQRNTFYGISRNRLRRPDATFPISIENLTSHPAAPSAIPAIEAAIDARRLIAKIRNPKNREAVAHRHLDDGIRRQLTGKFKVTEGRISQRIRAGLDEMARAAGA